MGNRHSANHIAEDHTHTDITCNTEEPQQKYRLGTAHKKNSNISTDKLGTWFVLILFFCSVVPYSEAVPDCFGTLDTIFVLDVSASITDDTIDLIRTFVSDAVDLFRQSIQDDFRFGAIWYATNVYDGVDIIHLTDDQTAALSRIQSPDDFDRTSQTYFTANTAAALDKMEAIFDDEGRLATWVCILITDSISSDQNATEAIAAEIEQTRIHVFPIGIGPELSIDQIELEKIATGTIAPIVVDDLTEDGLADLVTKEVCAVTEVENRPNVTKNDVAFDIYFLLEESDQVLSPDYAIMKDFVKMIMRTFEIGESSARVGVFNFASQVLPAYTIGLGTSPDEASFFSALDNLHYNVFNTGRNLDAALGMLTQSINANSVPNRPVVNVIITSGPSENGAEAVAKAEALKARQNPNVYTAVIGVAASDSVSWKNERMNMSYNGNTTFLVESFPMLVNPSGDDSTFSMVRNTIYNLASGTVAPATRWSAPFDIVFAVDGSGQVRQFIEFPLFLTVIEALIEDFELGVGAGRVGLSLLDASGVYTTIRLGNYLDREDLYEQIRDLVLLNRTSTSDNAIAVEAIRDHFASAPRDAAKIGYLITMSGSSYPILTQAHARAAAEEGIQLIEVGVGDGVNQENLQSLQMFQPFGILQSPVVFTPPFLFASDSVLDRLRSDLEDYAGLKRIGQLFPWTDAEFDLIVLLHDEAGRVDMGLETKRFLNSLFSRYLIRSDKVRVGVITFGAGLNTGVIELGTRDSLGSLVLAVSLLDLAPTGGPNIQDALDEMISMFDRNPRAGVNKLALLMVAGTPTDIEIEDFNKARDSGISMLTLGVGETDQLILESLAFNHELSYMQEAWPELEITARMDADIIALSQGVFNADVIEPGLRLAVECSHPASIVFLIDLSDSISPLLDSIKDFIGVLLSGFDLNVVEIGMIGFSTNVISDTHIPVGSITNYPQLYINFRMRMQQSDVFFGTGTGSAINFMREEMFSGTTLEKKIGIVVSDGVSMDPTYTITEADAARAEGIDMITIGVGANSNDVFLDELLVITGNNTEAVFSFDTSDFDNTDKLQSVHEYICQVAKPPVTCVAGTYYDADTDSCIVCPRGEYQSLENETECTPCAKGLTTPGTGTTDIAFCFDPCDSGRTWDGSICISCGFGKYRNKLLDNTCQDCDTGFITLIDMAEDSTACVANCDAGFEWNVTMCTPCLENFYQPEPYQLDCLECPNQWVTLSTGATTCVSPCVEGEFWNAGPNVCNLCPLNFYQPLPHQESCLECLNGLITLFNGSALPEDCVVPCVAGEQWDAVAEICVPCPPGSFQPEDNEDTCEECPFGETTPGEGSSDAGDCYAICPDGDYVECAVNPCDLTTCVNYPEATCSPNYCGECSTIFTLDDGTDVTAFCQDPSCSEAMDLVIGLDISGSIDAAQLGLVKGFLQNLVISLDIDADKIRVAIISVGSVSLPTGPTHLNATNMSQVSVSLAIHDLALGTGAGNTSTVIADGVLLMELEGRPDIPKLFLLITDGSAKLSFETKMSASFAEIVGVDVLVLGVGPDLDVEDLGFLAKKPEYVVIEQDFTGLPVALISELTCDAAIAYEEPETATNDLAGSCPNRLEIVVLMDVSGSFGGGDITWMQIALLNFASQFEIGPDKVRFGIIKFDVIPEAMLELNGSNGYPDVSAAILASLGNNEQGTNTGDALLMGLQFLEESRPGVPKAIVTVTDGSSSNPEDTLEKAEIVKDNFIYSVVVGIGPTVAVTEIHAIATDPDSILTYDTTQAWVESPISDLVETVCPGTFECSSPIDIAFVWDLESKEAMMSGLRFTQDLRSSFSDSQVTAVFMENHATIGDAVADAQVMLEGIQRSNAVSIILVMTGGNISGNEALSSAVANVKDSSIILAAIKTNSSVGDDWREFVSGPEVYFEVEQFDQVDVAWFIQKSLCRATCPSGSEVDGSMSESCHTCPQGMYRDSAAEYRCTSCGENTTTVGPGSTSGSMCVVDCPPGEFWNNDTSDCEDCTEPGQYQPNYAQFSCIDCSAGSEPTEDRTACSDCPPGTYWNAGTSECENCPEGQYQSDYGQLSCLTCPAGSEPTEDRTDCNLPCTMTMDLILVVDTSDSIDSGELTLMKEFLQSLVASLDIGPEKIRVAVVPVKTMTVETDVTHLNDTGMSHATVGQAIDDLTSGGGTKDISSAFGVTIELIQLEGRTGSPKIILLIMDGPSNSLLETKLAAAMVATYYIDVIAVGVGPDIDVEELELIAKGASYVVTEATFTGLPALDLTSTVCNAAANYELPPEPVTLGLECANPFELVVLMDVSTSFTFGDITWMQIAVLDLASKFEIGQDKVRIAIISFDVNVNLNISLPLRESLDYPAVSSAVLQQLRASQDGTNTGAALLTAMEFCEEGRPGVPVVLVTITDGASDFPEQVLASASEIKNKFIYSVVVAIGSSVAEEEIQAVATHSESIVRYHSTEGWVISLTSGDTQLVDKICPEAFECSTPTDIAFIWDLQSKDSMISALRFIEDFRFSFLDIEVTTVFSEHFSSLGEAIVAGQEMLEDTQRSQAVSMIIVLTDGNITDPQGLALVVDLALDSGIILGAINADPDSTDTWSEYVSDVEVLFEEEQFDSEQYAWFIQKGFCRASCPSGFEVDPTLSESCSSCPQGSYRDSAAEYRCIECPVGTTTVDIESPSSSSCIVDCLPGTYWDLIVGGCESCPGGEHQPESAQFECTPCPPNTQPTPDKTGCRSMCTEPMDLILLVDTSQSISPDNFNLLKSFLGTQVNRFDVNSDVVRVACGPIQNETFSADISSLTGSMSEANVMAAVNDLTQGLSLRNMASALSAATDVLTVDGRDDVAQIIFLITNGISINPLDTKMKSAEARMAGIEGVVLGIGAGVDEQELNGIASAPELVFKEGSFLDFTTLPDVWEDICQVARDFVAPVEPPVLDGFCPDVLDIVFLMDSSESLGPAMSLVKGGLVNIADQLDIGQDRIRPAVISFGNTVNEGDILTLSEADSKTTVQAAIESQPQDTEPGLLTNTAEGLAKSQEVFETSRSDVPRVLVTVTDGVSANPIETIEMAEEVRRDFTYSVLVGIGLGTDLDSLNPEFQAIATSRDSTILYDSALEFTLGFQNVLDKICPGEFMCNTPMDLVTVRHVEDTDVLAEALRFRQQMQSSYTALNDIVFNLDGNTPLEEAVEIAHAHFQLPQMLSQLNITKRQVSLPLPDWLVLPSTDSTKMVLIISDKLIENPSGLFAATKSARDDAILIAVINARTEPDVIWESYVSDKDLLFEVESFSSAANTWFIQQGCCRAQCVSGSQMSPMGVCTPCPRGTFRDSTSSHMCTSCATGTTTPSEGATSAAACTDLICGEGTEFISGTCEDCPRGKYKADGDAECISCPENFTTIGPRSTDPSDCVPDCPAGVEFNGSVCVDCPDNTFQPFPYSKDPCIPCDPLLTPFNTNDRQGCKAPCISGERWNKNRVPPACNWCPVGTFNDDSLAESCTACPAGTTTTGIGKSFISDCVPGCGPGEKWTGSTCMECDVDTFQDAVAPHDISECIPCHGDTMTVGTGSTSMADCLPDCIPGTRWVEAASLCVDCAPGSVQPASQPHGITSCTMCSGGTFQPASGQSACSACPGGTPFSTADGTACFGPCPAGQFYDQDTGACAACPFGTYSDTANSETCTDCPTGETTMSVGSTSMADCMMGCTPGEMMVVATLECVPCEPGTFQPGNDPGIAVMCMDCPPDTAQPDPGQAMCDSCTPPAMFSTDDRTGCKENCPTGQYYDQTTQSCEPCPIGTYSDSTGTEECTPCPTGTTTVGTGNMGAGDCMPGCKPGEKMDIATGNCVACEPGTFQPANEPGIQIMCMACPEGSVAPEAGSAECTDCPDTAPVSSDDRTTCLGDCPRGSFFNSSAMECEFCPDGTFQNETGQDSCIPCPSDASADRTRCVASTCCIDIVIAVDLSKSLKENDCSSLKEFLCAIIKRLKTSRKCTRVGIIKFAKSPVCVIHLRDGFTIRRVGYQIDKHLRRKSQRSNVNTCGALRVMNTLFARERRRGVPLRGLLMMDEMSDNSAAAAAKAEKLREKGVGLTVIGTDQTEVEAMATPGSSFIITDYSNLPSVEAVVDSFCRGL